MAKQPKNFADEDKDSDERGQESIHDADRQTDDHDEERLNDRGGAGKMSRVDATHEASSRELDSREVTQDADRLDNFRRSMFQSALPSLPDIPGYHVCWLTTTNPRDPIQGRLMLGYELIKSSEIPGYDLTSVKNGDYAGYIGVNEMIAAKIPLRLYKMYMTEAHHNAPMQEEAKLRSATEMIAEEAAEKSGKRPELGEGTARLGKGPARPKFEGV
jgi:hypothetical protein